MIKAVIFDMDGLLIDSEPFWRKAHMAVLAEDGFVITEDDVRHTAGQGTARVVEVWRNRFGWDAGRDPDLVARIEAHVLASILSHGKELPGVSALIRELESHGVPMAVASSSASEIIDLVLQKLGLRSYMQAVHSAKHEKRSKPFPDVFLSTAKTLGVAPKDCLVFEDSLNGVRAAKAAGMRCIAVPEAPYNRDDFVAAKADKIIGSLEAVHWQDMQRL